MEPLRVHAPNSVASAVIRWRRAARSLATVVAKVTYGVDAGRLEARSPEPLVAGEKVDPVCGLLACDEVVPLRPRADVLAVGCLRKAGAVRLVYRRGGVPLVDRRAEVDITSLHGASLAAFGPRNRANPERAVLGAWPNAGPRGLELGPSLDPRLFQTAPVAQQIDTIEPGDVLMIETGDDSVGFAVPALSMVCSVRRPAVMTKHGTAPLPPAVNIDMRADELSFDVERRIATFTFRCQVALEEGEADPVMELVVRGLSSSRDDTPRASAEPRREEPAISATTFGIPADVLARASVGTPFEAAVAKKAAPVEATAFISPELIARASVGTPFQPPAPGAPPPAVLEASAVAPKSLLGSGTATLAPEEVARARELAGLPPFRPQAATPFAGADVARAAANAKLMGLSSTAVALPSEEIAKARAAALAPFMKDRANAAARRPQPSAPGSALPFGSAADPKPTAPAAKPASTLDTVTIAADVVAEARAKAMPFGAGSTNKDERKSFHVPSPIRVDSGTTTLPGDFLADLRAKYSHLGAVPPAPPPIPPVAASAPVHAPSVPLVASGRIDSSAALIEEESLAGLGAAFLEALARVEAA